MSTKNLAIILIGSLFVGMGIWDLARIFSDPSAASGFLTGLGFFGLLLVVIGIRNIRYEKTKTPTISSSNDFGKKQSTDKILTESPSHNEKPIKIKKYTYGFVQEFGDIEKARQHFTNFVKYVEENNSTFPFGIYLSEGIIIDRYGDEEKLIWVLHLYNQEHAAAAERFYLPFQRSPLYQPSGHDNYMFTSNRQQLFYEAVSKGKMKVLEVYDSSTDRHPKSSVQNTSESISEKARKAGQMHLQKLPIPPEWKGELLLALTNEDVVTRRWAASALEAFNEHDVIKALETALRDQDPNVRFAAGRSLFRLKGNEVRPMLEQMLANETSDYVRDNITALINGQ